MMEHIAIFHFFLYTYIDLNLSQYITYNVSIAKIIVMTCTTFICDKSVV